MGKTVAPVLAYVAAEGGTLPVVGKYVWVVFSLGELLLWRWEKLKDRLLP